MLDTVGARNKLKKMKSKKTKKKKVKGSFSRKRKKGENREKERTKKDEADSSVPSRHAGKMVFVDQLLGMRKETDGSSIRSTTDLLLSLFFSRILRY